MMSYERSCRLCLTDLTEAPVDCSNIPEISETVNVLFDVQICRTDNIRCICNHCLDYAMGYRALKKKITECQKIIQDYENVRKKVMETRNIARIIKQEIIDVDAFDAASNSILDTSPTIIANPKRTRPTAVTDSDINNILALVHDKSTRKRAPNLPIAHNLRSIKTESNTPPVLEPENRSPSIEPISSTSRDIAEKTAENSNVIGSSSTSRTSGNSVGLVKSKKTAATVRSSPTDTNAEAVSSSVQTPNEVETKRQSERVSSRKRQFSINKSPVKRNSTKETNSPKKRNSRSPRTTLLNSTSCPKKFKLSEDLKSHLHGKHKSMPELKCETPPPRVEDIKREEYSMSWPGSRRTSARQSARQARIQVVQKVSPKTDRGSKRRSIRTDKPTDTPNNSLNEPRQTSTPLPPTLPNNSTDKSPMIPNQSIKSENSSDNSTFIKDGSMNKSDKKRIITITLVRTKDSLNFRYCDQFKRHIDFNTVSADELEDIRKSLMVPEIWANLREAFKNSPPDVNTIDQLKTILGDEFIL